MTRYTNIEGQQTILCDQCRQDIPVDGKAFTLAPGIIADGYVKKDYDKAELVLCEGCAHTMGRVLAFSTARFADNLLTREAA